jgi:AcrR family transcriptional regulator
MENAILGDEIVGRIAERSRARRHPDYDDEVRRLLTAALAVMSRSGTGAAPKVADIVAEAGLSNVAFYRHFPSKEALVDALVEDGTLRLRDYLAHQMGKERTPVGKVRRWVEGVMTQTGGDIAATTLAVLSNGGGGGAATAGGRHRASVPLAELLEEPFGAIGGEDAGLAASLVTHAMLGRVSDHLSAGTQPDTAELRRLVRFARMAGGMGDAAGTAEADGSEAAENPLGDGLARRRDHGRRRGGEGSPAGIGVGELGAVSTGKSGRSASTRRRT